MPGGKAVARKNLKISSSSSSYIWKVLLHVLKKRKANSNYNSLCPQNTSHRLALNISIFLTVFANKNHGPDSQQILG